MPGLLYSKKLARSLRRTIMKYWLIGVLLTITSGLPAQQAGSKQLVYADFEHLKDARPVSNRGGQIFLYGYEKNKNALSEYTHRGTSFPAPRLLPAENGMTQRATFEFEIKAPNEYAGVGLAVYGLSHADSHPTAEDVSSYDTLTFQASVEGTQRIMIHLISEGNGINLRDGSYPQYDLTVHPGFNLYRLKLKDFLQPDWAPIQVSLKSVLKKLTAIHFVVNTVKSKGKMIIDNIIFTSQKSSINKPDPGRSNSSVPPVPANGQIPGTSDNPFIGKTLWVDIDSQIFTWIKANPDSSDRALIQKIANTPQFTWLGDWSGDPEKAVREITTKAGNQLVGLVLYNIPHRDNGGYSAGGLASEKAYQDWIDGIVRGIKGKHAFVVEPDALGHWSDLRDQAVKETRLRLLKYAIEKLSEAGQAVYLEMAQWHSPEEMVKRYRMIGTDKNRGFAINVSGFELQNRTEEYAERLYILTGKPTIIDTSRNGSGPWSGGSESWCNPPDRALGKKPQAVVLPHIDAYVWVKRVGESDGTCRGGPPAGTFWPAYAIGLAQKASW